MQTWQKAKYDPIVRKKLMLREWVVDAIRLFFKHEGFHEVETPIMVPSPDPEPTIEPLSVTYGTGDGRQADAYVITSPEFSLKKILAAGVGNIFEITKSFRGSETPSNRHNGEFTILEWYRTDADYSDIMKDCENLLRFIAGYVESASLNQDAVHSLSVADVNLANSLQYQGKTIEIASQWERISVLEAFERFAQVDEATFFDRSKLAEIAQQKGYVVESNTSLLELQTHILVNEIEPNLGSSTPTFLYDYPADQAALSRKKAEDPRLAERFEWYVAGLELGNAFSELADPVEQEARLRSQMAERASTGRATWPIDEQLIEALQEGIPSAGGIAVGVDRLVMLFADTAEIQDVLWFPQHEWDFHTSVVK